MIVYVLFVWFTAAPWPVATYAYATQAECEESREMYRRARCMQLVVPAPTRK
jgi:hypothetical protein